MAQIPVLQRLVKLTTMLTAAGPTGWAALELADALGYGGTPESRREALARDIRNLRKIGIEIDNTAEEGEESRWVLQPRDSRVQLEFPPEELAELARAAVLAGKESLPGVWGGSAPSGPSPLELHTSPPSPEIDPVLRAVSARCRLTFTYNGRERDVSPATVSSDSGGWSVTGYDESRAEVRTFYVRRMTGVRVGQPGSARTEPRRDRSGTDPLGWDVDEPLTATLTAPAEFVPDAVALLRAQPDPDDQDAGPPAAAVTDPGVGADPDEVRLVARVTNRVVFLVRLIELGPRVRLVGPPELRRQLGERLGADAGREVRG